MPVPKPNKKKKKVQHTNYFFLSFLLFLGTDKKLNYLESKKILPFIPKAGPKLPTPKLSDSGTLVEMISNNQIWCPSEEVNHNNWITNLVSSFISSLSDDIVFQNLASLCQVKVMYYQNSISYLEIKLF